ncbi:MAG: phospholipase D-like domain-containing protein [Candidatus Solibacter sp.]
MQNLLRPAERSVLVAGYAGNQLFEELGRRMDEFPTLHVRVFLNVARKSGETGSDAEVIASFLHRFRLYNWPAQCRLPELYYDCRALAATADCPIALHAKCIVVDERETFISSANFTEAAQHRNVEVGVLIRSSAIGGQAAEFFSTLVREGLCVRAG